LGDAAEHFSSATSYVILHAHAPRFAGDKGMEMALLFLLRHAKADGLSPE
jgi:hypothetical protein